MTRLHWLIGCAALATGCMKGVDGLSDAQARAAGDALGTGIEDSAKQYGPVDGAASADSNCVTPSGDSADPDLDNIPVSARLTYNCTAQALGYTGMLTGTLMVTDDNPQAAAWAFTGTADLHGQLTGPFGGTIVRDVDGQLKATQASAVGPFALARTLDVVTVSTPPGERARSSTVTEDIDWTVTFTPMATWTPGGVAVIGNINATGTWNVDVDGHDFTATISTPTAVKVDPACATAVTAGVVKGTYEDGNVMKSITVTWTACGQRTVVHAGAGALQGAD